jgi:ligand-binding sensor domain-containing protein
VPTIKPVAALVGWLACATSVAAQVPSSTPSRHPEEGRPFISAYAPAELGGDNQNWAIAQDARGVIYVGSQPGVLEFDGVSWRLIETPDLTEVRSLAADANGRIYAGSFGEFGYLAPDANGQLFYVSLLEHVPQDARRFSDVWRTFVTPAGVFFQSTEYLFQWTNGTIQVIRPQSRFNRGSMVDGRIYLTTPEDGLNVLDGKTFRALPGTSALAREIYPVVLRYDDRRLLIGTRTNGLFLYDGSSLTPFRTELDDLIKTRFLYRGIAAPDGTIALSTTGGGFGIIDRTGRRLAQLDQKRGLPSDAVYYMMVDREGALWVAMDRGIARVETPSPASFFDRDDGFQDAFNLIRDQGRLYLAGNQGVGYLRDADAGNPLRVAPVSGLRGQCWWFEKMTDPSSRRAPVLMVACGDGLYEIRGTEAIPVRLDAGDTYRASVLLRSRTDPSRLWVGLFDGLASFRWADGRWIDEGRVEAVVDEVRTLFENANGSLWAGTSAKGLLRCSAGPPSRRRCGGVRLRRAVLRPMDRREDVHRGAIRREDARDRPRPLVRLDRSRCTADVICAGRLGQRPRLCELRSRHRRPHEGI